MSRGHGDSWELPDEVLESLEGLPVAEAVARVSALGRRARVVNLDQVEWHTGGQFYDRVTLDTRGGIVETASSG
jgi:hypothetical protein